MYGMQDERKPQDAPKVALTHQERMRREEAKKAIAADKDPTLAQINEGDLATPELRRLAAEFPQLMLPPDDPSRMSVPPEIVVRASLLLKQRDDNASQNSTAIIDESLRRREVRNSFGMILGYGDPAGSARIDLTGMRTPGTETAEEIRYGEMQARERREREWGEALAKIGGMTTDMIMALGGAMGQMGSGPRMQTSPGMLGLRDGQRMAPGEWNRPGSQMGTWWESLPTAAQQGMNVGARSAKMRGEVPMITPEGPISLTRSRQPGEPLQPTLQGGVAASQIAGASANPRLTGTTPALRLSEGTRQGMVSTGRPTPTSDNSTTKTNAVTQLDSILSPQDRSFLSSRHLDDDFLMDVLEEQGKSGIVDLLERERQDFETENETQLLKKRNEENEDRYVEFLDKSVSRAADFYESKGWTVTNIRGRGTDSRYISLIDKDDNEMVVRVSDHEQPKDGSYRVDQSGFGYRSKADKTWLVPTLEKFIGGKTEIVHPEMPRKSKSK